MPVILEADQAVPNTSIPAQEIPDSRQSVGENLDQQSSSLVALLNPGQPINESNSPGGENLDTDLDGLFTWPDDSFLNATFDWFALSNQQLS